MTNEKPEAATITEIEDSYSISTCCMVAQPYVRLEGGMLFVAVHQRPRDPIEHKQFELALSIVGFKIAEVLNQADGRISTVYIKRREDGCIAA